MIVVTGAAGFIGSCLVAKLNSEGHNNLVLVDEFAHTNAPGSRHAKRYQEFFDLFVKHQDKIKRVTLWGVQDGQSWKNNFPVPGRTDYPLLFDRNYQPKSFVKNILSLP